MPSPSKLHLFTGLAATSVLLALGAYAAASISGETIPTAETPVRGGYTAAPVPRAVDPKIKDIQVQAPIIKSVETKSNTMLSQSQKKASQEPLVPSNPEIKTLNVTIENIRSNYGNLIVMIFADDKSFKSYDYTKAVGYTEVQAKAGSISMAFPELRDGPYVVSMFHDENSNQSFDMEGNYPAEGYGTSNAKNKYDDLSFKKASVMAGEVKIRMYYLEE